MKKIVFLAFLCIVISSLQTQAKKYKFTFAPPYDIEQVRVSQQGTKFVKAWAVDKNADKAIILAKQNAVAAMLFTGIAENSVLGCGYVPPICTQRDAYETHKEYFDKFFQEGEFLKYAYDVNSTYPTGENNMKTPNGRRVGIYLQLLYEDLRQRLIKDEIIKGLGQQFRY